jgi:hypothetical protein
VKWIFTAAEGVKFDNTSGTTFASANAVVTWANKSGRVDLETTGETRQKEVRRL